MHSIGAYLQDKSVAVAVHAQNGAGALVAGTAQRMREHRRRLGDETGQTAVEYAGILILVAVLIGALFTIGLDGKIKEFAKDAINQVAGHCKSEGNQCKKT
jgi:Flp pilus assembly pilin Flp